MGVDIITNVENPKAMNHPQWLETFPKWYNPLLVYRISQNHDPAIQGSLCCRCSNSEVACDDREIKLGIIHTLGSHFFKFVRGLPLNQRKIIHHLPELMSSNSRHLTINHKSFYPIGAIKFNTSLKLIWAAKTKCPVVKRLVFYCFQPMPSGSSQETTKLGGQGTSCHQNLEHHFPPKIATFWGLIFPFSDI